MRDDVQEIGPGKRVARGRSRAHAPNFLLPTAIDEALADETTLDGSPAPSGGRRDAPLQAVQAVRMAIDEAHSAAARIADTADENLLRQLSRELRLLETQQRQIRRLLESSERRMAAKRRIDL